MSSWCFGTWLFLSIPSRQRSLLSVSTFPPFSRIGCRFTHQQLHASVSHHPSLRSIASCQDSSQVAPASSSPDSQHRCHFSRSTWLLRNFFLFYRPAGRPLAPSSWLFPRSSLSRELNGPTRRVRRSSKQQEEKNEFSLPLDFSWSSYIRLPRTKQRRRLFREWALLLVVHSLSVFPVSCAVAVGPHRKRTLARRLKEQRVHVCGNIRVGGGALRVSGWLELVGRHWWWMVNAWPYQSQVFVSFAFPTCSDDVVKNCAKITTILILVSTSSVLVAVEKFSSA